MTDRPKKEATMKLAEYAEQAYKCEPLTNKLFVRIPRRLSVWI